MEPSKPSLDGLVMRKKALPVDKRTEPELLEKMIVKRKKAGIYTPDEMKKIAKGCVGELRDVVVSSGFCGLRSSEVTGEEADHPPLPCEAILFDVNQVRVAEQKVQKKGDRPTRHRLDRIPTMMPTLIR